jgi:hypothetical protein
MSRWGIATAALLTAVGLGLSGCGPTDARTADGPAAGGAGGSAIEVVAGLGPEGQALAALGLDADDLDLDVEQLLAPAPAPSVAPEGSTAPERAGDRPRRERAEEWRKKRHARVLLRKGTLHGEAVVRTRDGGTKTVLVQRGEVTAIDGDSMTVKSTDGYTMTWRFGDDLRVVERRSTVQPEQVKVGSTVGVAGTKDGDAGVARLVVLPRTK